jgi:hypothetical protein
MNFLNSCSHLILLLRQCFRILHWLGPVETGGYKKKKPCSSLVNGKATSQIKLSGRTQSLVSSKTQQLKKILSDTSFNTSNQQLPSGCLEILSSLRANTSTQHHPKARNNVSTTHQAMGQTIFLSF